MIIRASFVAALCCVVFPEWCPRIPRCGSLSWPAWQVLAARVRVRVLVLARLRERESWCRGLRSSTSVHVGGVCGCVAVACPTMHRECWTCQVHHVHGSMRPPQSAKANERHRIPRGSGAHTGKCDSDWQRRCSVVIDATVQCFCSPHSGEAWCVPTLSDGLFPMLGTSFLTSCFTDRLALERHPPLRLCVASCSGLTC